MPRHWDHHYSNPDGLDFTPAPLLVEVADRLVPGCALDLACGHGRNAIYLAGLGWRVTALDSSPAAIHLLRERSPGLSMDARVADLEAGEFRIGPASFDLICDFFYLQRDLFPQIREGVRPGGLFVGAIHLFDPAAVPRRNPAFQLRPGEFREEFVGWKILFYSEGLEPGRTRPAARIVARRA
ncbi:MAG TPA: methyltransferase domain-containing protein [Bryobacteraceae bacterium]|nr:methyltransferase domain-containing protein [Bryobacteraceae bacterium]